MVGWSPQLPASINQHPQQHRSYTGQDSCRYVQAHVRPTVSTQRHIISSFALDGAKHMAMLDFAIEGQAILMLLFFYWFLITITTRN